MRKDEKLDFILNIESNIEENLNLLEFNTKYISDNYVDPFKNFTEFEEIPFSCFKLYDETLYDKSPHVVYTKNVLISDTNIVVIGDLNDNLRELNRRLHLIRSIPVSVKFIRNHLNNIDFAVITENGYNSSEYKLIKNSPIRRITEKQYELMFNFTINST